MNSMDGVILGSFLVAFLEKPKNLQTSPDFFWKAQETMVKCRKLSREKNSTCLL